MDSFYIATNDQQSGPMSLEDIQAKVKRGEYGREALYWKEGMDDWKPLSELVDFHYNPPPKPPPAPARGAFENKPHTTDSPETLWLQMLWMALIPLLAIAFVCSVASEFMKMESVGELIFLFVWLLIAAAGTLVSSLLHYKIWCSVDPDKAATTPGKAIGFIFIPFYNFYWAFITWPKLAEGISDTGYHISGDRKALAMWTAILFVSSWVFDLMIITGSSYMVYGGSYVVYGGYCVARILFYKQMIDALRRA